MNERDEGRSVARIAAAVLVVLVFFATVGGAFAWVASVSMAGVYALVALALIGIVYVATGGRAWFGTRERPERVLGARLRFSEVEGQSDLTSLPDAIVREWDGSAYRAELVEAVGEETGREILLSARHEGHPLWRVSAQRGCVVNGSIGQDEGFIAVVRRPGFRP